MVEKTDAVAVGFDLGHGESAIAWALVDKDNKPGVVDLPGATGRQHITAVAEHPQRGVLVGEEALTARGVSSLFFAFKSPYLARDEVRRPVELFVEKVVEDVEEARLLPTARRARWIFGAPSGWSGGLRDAYRDLLATAGCPELEVIPESRAALLYARDAGEVVLDEKQLSGAVLVVDMGSSTTDFTAVEGLRAKPFDHGTELGAHLLDKTVMARVLRDRPELQDVFDEDQWERQRMELACRKTKETFFRTDRRRFAANPDETITGLYQTQTAPRQVVVIELTERDMREVMETPQPALKGQSWLEAFRADLQAAVEKVGRVPDAVLLTGGASRMHWVRDMAVEECGGDCVLLGSEPELAIARGLALAGRTSVRAEGFRKDIVALLSSKRVESVVKDRLPTLATKVGEAAADGLTERHVVPAFKRWRRGEIQTLNDVAREIAKKVGDELADARNSRITRAVGSWQDSLRPELAELSRPVCERWHIPPSAMALPTISLDGRRWQVSVDQSSAVTESFESLATGIAAVVAGVVAMSLLGSGVAILAATGPFAVIVAAVVGFGVLVSGVDKAKEKAMSANIPVNVRQWGSEQKLVAKLKQQAKTSEAQVAQEMAKQLLADGGQQVVQSIARLIREELHRLAGEAELLIATGT